MINYLALIAALLIASVSGFFGVTGMTAIFPGALIPIICMAVVLEISKLITASWLYRMWNHIPILMRVFLTCTLIMLSSITSLGVFGYLAKNHISQQVNIETGTGEKVSIVENKIETLKLNLADTDKQIAQIDNTINKMIEKGKTNASLAAQKQQKKTREDLVKKREEQSNQLSVSTVEKIKLQSNVKMLEAEVGPLKYIADAVYGHADADQLEIAVRWLIIALVAVLDPFAIILLIAANHGFKLASGIKEEISETIATVPTVEAPSNAELLERVHELEQEVTNKHQQLHAIILPTIKYPS